VKDKIQDQFLPLALAQSELTGILGERMRINLEQRLLAVNTAPLLAGYVHRPGQQTWIGEHAGKFIDAATNAWVYGRNPALKAKLDETVKTLIASQMEDGYLGTYLLERRWTEWDVWAHKYNLIALLNYYRHTCDPAVLNACRRMGDLLVKTFGEVPGQRNIVVGDPHRGMASTSVLEGMDMLYRDTGDDRYLDFCRYIVRSWETPQGPHIISSLLKTQSVHQVADAKAYEMLSNFVGLLDLYRLTGEHTFLEPVLIAWTDIVANRLYLSGTTSWHECFLGDHQLPPAGRDTEPGVGEGCVTVTWMQVNLHLLRLTGEAKYAEELERTTYNALLAAQSPHAGTVCYFTDLNGRKMYGAVSQGVPGVSCCTSSLPRGIALLPQFVWGLGKDGIAINLYTPGKLTAELNQNGKKTSVEIRAVTDFPATGNVSLRIHSLHRAPFSLYLRVPEWSRNFVASVGGKPLEGTPGSYLQVTVDSKAANEITVRMEMTERIVPGDPSAPRQVAILRGPQLLALDEKVNAFTDVTSAAVDLDEQDKLGPNEAQLLPPDWIGGEAYSLKGSYVGNNKVRRAGRLVLVPFADAGQQGSAYRVWIGTADGQKS